ncbi:DUF397 domain-containing protein [Streptomyces sp. NPDC088400]|uniref:DUF397 domain-containing protein n=1 Tax=Streptomyces sp. NPDC088400 TaxID=3365861 RepID=UPI003820CF0D
MRTGVGLTGQLVAANLAASHGVVPVRDSKAPYGPHLTLTTKAFTELVAFAKTHH